MANIECNSTSATAIAYHFCMQMVGDFLQMSDPDLSAAKAGHDLLSCVMQIDKKMKGCMVFTSSAAACIPSPFGAIYTATKSFMSAFGASLAPEVKHHGIDVLVAHPSPVNSR